MIIQKVIQYSQVGKFWKLPKHFQERPYGYFEGINGYLVLHGVQRATAHVVSGVADWVGLCGPPEGHLSRGDGRLGGVLVVTMDEVGGQEDGDEEGQQHGGGNDGFADVVTHGLWIRQGRRGQGSKRDLNHPKKTKGKL